MNSLSWLIYIASIVEKITSFIGGISFVLFFALGTGVLISLLVRVCEENERDRQAAAKVFKTSLIWLCLPFFLSIVFVLIPSQNTVYMIAASEMGETVITNPQSQEIFNDLKDIINLQLDSLKSDLTKSEE